MLLLITSFVSGILTILTPCVLPLLPIILGGTLSDTKNNQKHVIIFSLLISIFFFTLILKVSSIFINVPEDFWTYVSAFLITFLGLTFIFPSLWEKLNLYKYLKNTGNKINKIAVDLEIKQENFFWKNVLTGVALGPIFSSCSPTYFIILATVLPVNFYLGILYLTAYILGLGLSLYLVASVSEQILTKIDKIINKNMFKNIIGILFIAVGILIFTGWDKEVQAQIAQPEIVKKVESKLLKRAPVQKTQEVQKPKIVFQDLGTAKELEGITGYLNVKENTTLKEILSKNKVVMLEFWTYSCINCKRTFPYVNKWYEKYKNQGFEIVSVHTPEFAFEKVKSNVLKNSKKMGIKFPIFMDNNYATWNAYQNQYWPMRILIIPKKDKDGQIVGQIIYQHAGEGDYENNEAIIKQALGVN